MPDGSGLLSQEDMAKIRAWWEQHWKGPILCPICKSNDWHTYPHLVRIIRDANDALFGGTIAYPQVAVACNICGHSIMFNAVKIGLVPSAASQVVTPSFPALPKAGG
jgi:hypothetical protein